MFPIHDDNPTTITPYITFAVIGLCTLAFFWQLSLGADAARAVYGLGAIPAVLFESRVLSPELTLVPTWLTPFTSMFIHGGWMHIIGNMLYLWIFGNNVEEAMGHLRFAAFYVLCGVAAVFAQALTNIDSTTPMIGASGAISGVLGAYLLLYPHARVLVVVPIGFFPYTTRLPAGWVLGFWFLLQLLSSLLTAEAQGGVAWSAHVGGFVAGMALLPLFRGRDVRLFAPRR